MNAHNHYLKKEAASSAAAGLLIMALALSLGAAPPNSNVRRAALSRETGATATQAQASPTAPAAVDDTITVDVLKGQKSGQLSVTAEGTGDGRMTLSLTNRTNTKLRVILPPGLIASGATGQFGGGMGGMGGGMGGMGGGMGGMGGMGGGMGGMGGGMGGMGGGMGGRGGMSGGMGMGGGTMPATMGMMMLGRLIMSLVATKDSWDSSSLMMGMMGGMGGGMGGMMGGMGGGMGGMGGGMGGGFRSVPPTSLLQTTLQPHQARHLPTPVVSLNGPGANAEPLVPAKGERLQIIGIDQATDDLRTRTALKRLAEAKAPRSVAQMVLWYVTAGADWDDVGRLSQGWGNAQELALARQFVAGLEQAEEGSLKPKADPGLLYWDIKAEGDRSLQLANGLRVLWGKYPVLGLTAKEGVPTSPNGPALACRLEVSDAAVSVKLSASHPAGSDWTVLGTFPLKPIKPELDPGDPAPGTTTSVRQRDAARLGDAVAEGLLARLVRLQLARGPKIKGKESFRIKIVNESPMILNGLALGGSEAIGDHPPSVLMGLSLPPLKSLTVSGSAEMVERLHLKDGARVVAADLSGL